MRAAVTIRSNGNRRMAMVIWAAAALVGGLILADGGPTGLLRYVLFPVAIAALAWLVYWRPHVRVDPGGVRLVNVLRTVTIPWGAITAVASRWGLRVEAGGRTYRAWAVAPAAGAPAPAETSLLDLDEGVDLEVSADAGQVARLIELHVPESSGTTDAVARRFDVLPVALVLGIAVLALLVRALPL